VVHLDARGVALESELGLSRAALKLKFDEEPAWIYTKPTLYTNTGLAALSEGHPFPRSPRQGVSVTPRNATPSGRLTPFPPSRSPSRRIQLGASVLDENRQADSREGSYSGVVPRELGKGYPMSNRPNRVHKMFGTVRRSMLKKKATARPSILPLWLEHENVRQCAEGLPTKNSVRPFAPHTDSRH